MTRGAARSGLLRASLGFLTLAGLLLDCEKPAPPPPVLEVEYTGCWAFYLPELCSLVPKRELTLWVRTTPPDRKVELHAGKRLLKPREEEKVKGGKRYVLPITKPTDPLTVEVVSPDGKRGPSWSLRLAEPEQPSWWGPVKDLIRHGEKTEARRRLEQVQRSAPPKEQSLVWRQLALVARAEGNNTAQEQYLKQGIAAEGSEHRWSGVVKLATWLAGIYINQARFSDAEQILAKLQPLPPKAAADDKFNVIFYQGDLAAKTSNYAGALKHFQAATVLAQQIGDLTREGQVDQVLALVYQQLGRPQEASALFAKQQDSEGQHNCADGTFWTNVGWFQLLEHEVGSTAEDPAPALQKALSAFEADDCPSEEKLNAHLNLALAYQQRNQWPEADRELAQARALTRQADFLELLWQNDLEARAALHAGHPEVALDLYATLEKRSERVASPAGLLQAQLGRAKAYVHGGKRPEAIVALAKAEDQIEEQSLHIPVHEGRDTYLANQEAVTRLHLELLLAGDQKKEAFDLARKSRSRLLRQLAVRDSLSQLKPEEKKAWIASLSKFRATRAAIESAAASRWKWAVSEKESALEDVAEKVKHAQDDLDLALRDLDALRRNGEGPLAPPERDEVILAYHPLPEKKWAAFAATEGREPVVAEIELPENISKTPPEQLAQILLSPSKAFQAAIASAKRVKILPYGPLRSVDFQALPFDGTGQPLLLTHRVVYSLDLTGRSASPNWNGQPLALVVSNPTKDLRTADAEGNTVVTAIKNWPEGWTLKPLSGIGAKAGTVRDALTEASFFHYAGHGVFGGFAGWSSELPLADQSSLTLSDILALSHVPDSIVLSACDAGRTSEEAPGEGVGLANAFLLAGAKEVVAARQSVLDSSANELMAEMYRHWQPGEDLQHQLRRAQLTCRKKDPSPKAAWASFRLLVP